MTPKSTIMVDLAETDLITVTSFGEGRVLVCLGHPRSSEGKVMITLPASRISDLAQPLMLLNLASNLSALGEGVEKLGDVMARAVDTVNAQRLAERAADADAEADPKIITLADRRPS